jgi:putative integral membrane protein (TIGR02587 family)
VRTAHGWRDELRDQVRGFAGGMLFGIPLLFTMEVWWVGSHAPAGELAAVLALTLVVVFLLNRLAGFRDDKPRTTAQAAQDSVESVAMGLLVSALVLVALRELTLTTPLDEALGKVVYHSVTASIGVSLAAQFFRGSADTTEDDGDGSGGGLAGTVVDLGATAIGAMFVCSAIAPTDEIPMLSGGTSPAWLLVVMAFSLVVSYCVVFVSGFANEKQRRAQQGVLQRPATETMAAYLVALMVAALMLVVFKRVDLAEAWHIWLPDVLLLGLPAAVGGAAGRLAV